MRSTEIKRVAPSVDCMTTSVAIAAQYASGKPKRRATAKEIVAAMAVRIECMTDGRFSGSHFQSFTRPIFRMHPESATPIWRWNALPLVMLKGHGHVPIHQVSSNARRHAGLSDPYKSA